MVVARFTGAGALHTAFLRCLPDSAPSRPLLLPVVSVIPVVRIEPALRVHDRAAIADGRADSIPGRPGRGEHDWRFGHNAKLGQQNPRVKQIVSKMQKKSANGPINR